MEFVTHIDPPDNGSYTVNDSEITSFSVQAGFVEGIIPDQQSFDSFPAACSYVFRNNKESGIMLINGLPVKFNYPTDVPCMMEPLTEVLEKWKSDVFEQETLLVIDAPSFASEWNIRTDSNGMLTITTKWNRVEGNYETALNTVGLMRISATDFMAEWSMLIKQVNEAFKRSGIVVSGNDATLLQRLNALGNDLTDVVGKLYREQKTMD